MSLNILIKRFIEGEINNNIHVDGKWKVEVVCPNGEIKKPLGDKWRKNLIQDRGLNIFNGTFSTSIVSSPNGYSLDNFIYSAVFGDDGSNPFSTNNIKQTSLNANTYWTSRLTQNVPENANPTKYTDNLSEGSRTFTRAWDFPALADGETRSVKEILITTMSQGSSSTSADQIKGSQYSLYTNMPVISRFVLPQAIPLTRFQFLRLYYSIKVTVPSIATAVNLNLQSGDFDGTGQLKLVGAWSRIFGSLGHYWQYRENNAYTSTVNLWCPWSLIGRDGVGGAIVKGNTDPNLNYNFPLPNVDSPITYSRLSVDTQTVTNNSAGGSMSSPQGNATELTVVNDSVSREATLLFPANNPSNEEPIGGIFIVPSASLTAGSVPLYTDSRTPSTAPAAGGVFWYWRFTNETFSAPRSEIKDRNYGLAINLRQTMSRG